MTLPVIVVFARVPRLGVGKRRLASRVGDRAALRFSRSQFAALSRELRPLRGFCRVVALTPDRHAHHGTRGFSGMGQGKGDLGDRMSHVFQRYPRRPVIIIGSDIPGITSSDLRNAYRHLRGSHAVFGPATDGGYWLIGLAARRPAHPFAGVRWSTEHALADTLRNFPDRRVVLLRALADVDTHLPDRASEKFSVAAVTKMTETAKNR